MDTINKDHLMQRFLSGTISESEADTLLSLLENDPVFRKQAEQQREAEFLLRLAEKIQDNVDRPHESDRSGQALQPIWEMYAPVSASQDPLPDGLNMDELIRLAALSPSLPERKTPEPTSSKPRKAAVPFQNRSKSEKHSHWKWFAGLGLVALFGFLIYQEFQPKREEVGQVAAIASTARVTQLADPVFPEDAPIFKRDQQIGDESIRLLSGSLELQLNNGVRIVLVGPVTFNVQSATATFCELGRVSVEVPKGAEGFEVQTPFANVRDLGTEFVVDVSETASAVHVIRGKVAVDKLTNVWITVVEGVGRIIDSTKSEKQIKADKSLFVAETMMQQASRLYESRLFSAWNVQRQRRAADPGTIFQLDFDEGDPEKGLVQKIGCRQATGRWSGKKALSISRSGDLVKLSANRQLDSFTLSASIRLDGLLRSSQTILSIGDQGRGALHWQITSLGEVQLLLGETSAGLSGYQSKAVLGRRDIGVWIHLTTTVDAAKRTITHYLDGKPVAVLEWKTPTKFDFSQAELGNWQRRERTPVDRHLNGRIDEFILLDHPLAF